MVSRHPQRTSQYPRRRRFLDDSAIGPEYATAMSLIILQIPNRYLPILQR